MFQDKIEFDDIVQGYLGDCYLMSVIAALSKKPELIKSIFKTQNVSSIGLYEIYYFEEGVKKIIFVDDFFPLHEDYKKPLFAKPHGEELWVLILEKAFAKYEGGYSNIEGGYMSDSFKFFTGSVTRNLRKLAGNWNEIILALTKNHIICAGSLSLGTDKEKSKNGIHYGHAYSVIDAKEYSEEEEVIRLIQVRNPWGSGEWKGDYSDGDSHWTPNMKKFFNSEEINKEDGRFWMTYDDFCTEFQNIIICYC